MPDPLPGLSVKQAAIALGTSESDVRRRIRRGELAAETFDRPGGTLLRVLMDTRQDAPGAAPAAEPTPNTGDVPAAVSEPPAAITALVDALAAEREERQKLSVENGELRERAARAEALAEAREMALEWTQAQLDQARAELERVRARRWWRFWE